VKEHLKEEDSAQREEEEEKEKHPKNLKICIALFMAKKLDIYPKCVPKLRKSIEEAQEENRAQSQSKTINHVRQEQHSTHQPYYPMHYGHIQALLPRPPPTYSYEPLEMYHPMQNQWR
jgi:hypothetical protein